MKRYADRGTFVNDDETYDNVFEERGIERITQYETKIFNKDALKKTYSVAEHTWSQGDKLYKLAHRYYGDRRYWWLIALWNGIPTEAHMFYGLTIEIPFPPDRLYREV